eukprot:ANDGO_01285.mRNA.1 hypothetical protein
MVCGVRVVFALVVGFAAVLAVSADSMTFSEALGLTPEEALRDRQGVYTAAMALYNQRGSEIYTEGSQRWSGITDRVYPPSAPKYSDCSSAATWAYWTVYGKGPDFLNGENWSAGYTGTLMQHGRSVSLGSAQVGDLVMYGNPVSHTAIYIGGGRVISHGEDPVCDCPIDYRSDRSDIRSYI